MEVPVKTCEDCEPTPDGLTVMHEPMCPIAVSVETATSGDKLWFEQHPFSDEYRRDIAWGEAAQLLLIDSAARELAETGDVTALGRVTVKRVNDDVRLRHFDDVYFVVRPL